MFGIRRQIIEDWKIYIVPKACVLSTLHHTPLCFTACRLINTGTIPAKRSKSSPFRLIHTQYREQNAIKPANLIAKSLFVQKKDSRYKRIWLQVLTFAVLGWFCGKKAFCPSECSDKLDLLPELDPGLSG